MATNNTAQLRDDADRSEAILDRIPAGRWGTPQDMEGAVIYLASKPQTTSTALPCSRRRLVGKIKQEVRLMGKSVDRKHNL